MTLMQCKNCGKGVETTSPYCDRCGAILPQRTDEPYANAKDDTQGVAKYGLFVPLGIITFFVMIGVAIMSPQDAKAINNATKERQSYEEEAMDKVSELTRPYKYRTLEGKVDGYKKALSELETLSTLNPDYKKHLVASLTQKLQQDYDSFVAQKEAEDELKKKRLEEKEKQIEANRKAAEEQNKKNEIRRKKLLASFKREKDEIENISFYTHKAFPAYLSSRSAIYPYIGKSDSHQWLRIKIQYTSDDWLFVEQIVVSTDGEKFVKNFNHWDWSRDNGSGKIWEWIDLTSDAELKNLLEKIADSKTAIVRFNGKQYRKDITITANDKKAIKETLEFLTL